MYTFGDLASTDHQMVFVLVSVKQIEVVPEGQQLASKSTSFLGNQAWVRTAMNSTKELSLQG